jgi:hypothetical protein
MKLSNEDKKNILEGFIDIFTRIASKEYQKRIWIRGEGPEVDSFDDAVNDFFIECDSILENYKDFGITDRQCEILEKFHNQFRTFCDERDWPQEFIDTPEWNKITEMANEILNTFHYKKRRK